MKLSNSKELFSNTLSLTYVYIVKLANLRGIYVFLLLPFLLHTPTVTFGRNAVINLFEKKTEDPFEPYLTGKAPTILQDLGEEIKGTIKVRKILFLSRNVQTHEGIQENRIFAVITRPSKPGNYPGLLVLHGGGGSAEIEKAEKWAALGYVVVTLDIPGVANPEKVPLSEGHWKTFTYGTKRFTAHPHITSSTIFDGALAALQGFYLLQSQADVIKTKIGIAGISWGGYLTTMVTGLVHSQVAASFSVFGSGNFDAGSVFLKELDKMPSSERGQWLQYLDAGRRIKDHHAPFFIAAAANDNWFYPPAVTATLLSMKGPVNHLFAANANHKIPDPGGSEADKTAKPGWLEMEQIYFDYYLKDSGLPFPMISSVTQKMLKKSDSKKYVVRFKVKSKTKLELARVYFSTFNKEWSKREWKEIPAERIGKNKYQATLPDSISEQQISWYPSISDSRPVSVSGYIKILNH